MNGCVVPLRDAVAPWGLPGRPCWRCAVAEKVSGPQPRIIDLGEPEWRTTDRKLDAGERTWYSRQ